jgi:Domain of unknown function (DUF4136)
MNCAALQRRSALLAGLALVSALAGCAGMATLTSEVATFGEWPAARKPGTFAFERLPSQEAHADRQALLEAAARPALVAAGFAPAAAGAEPEVLVQLGLRSTRYEASPWADPLWWRGGAGSWRYGPWFGPRWHPFAYDDWRRVDREAALLIRDRASGKPLYEARASSSSSATASAGGLRAMFEAALKDFPATGLNPRDVSVPLRD